MQWIDAKDLDSWSNLPEAQSELPSLIRSLALSTTNPDNVDIPSGSSVHLPGWDGKYSSSGGLFLPPGKVLFEISCRADVAVKANQDYKKRKKDTLGLVPAEHVYICVTSRIWKDKDDWAKERRAENFWKDVCVIDATVLAQWVDAAPAVASQFARAMGKVPPAGFIALTDFWDEWSRATKYVATPSLLVGGRDEQISHLSEWVKGPPASFYIQGEIQDEAAALLAAWAMTQKEEGERVLNRGIIVKSQDAWLALSRSKTPLFLIPQMHEEYAPAAAIKNKHHVLIPLGKGESPNGNGIVLGRMNRDAFLLALKEMGIPEREREALTNSTGRHLPTLRRRLIDHAGGQYPFWATPSEARNLLPALLLGQWTESEGDLKVLSALADLPAADVLAKYQALLNIPDSPLRKVGGQWRLVSQEEAWELLSPFLSQKELDNFIGIARELLEQVSPALDLDGSQRHMAAVYKKVLTHSDALREGVSVTLALMSARSDRLGANVSSVPLRVMRDVLENRQADWRFWATIGSILSTLAEATPEQILDSIEEMLKQQPGPFYELFKEEGDGIWGSCYHSGLLWALEKIAMSEEYFARAALCLAGLSTIDPGGRYSNRPMESLRGLYLSWIHYSDATDEARVNTLDGICKRYPEIGWKLVMGICPGGMDSTIGRQPPTFRPWGSNIEKSIVIQEAINYQNQIVLRALQNVKDLPDRWEDLLTQVSNFLEADRVKAFEQLEECIVGVSDLAKWEKVRSKIREMLNRNKTYPDSGWAMAEKDVERMQKIYESLRPSDAVDADGWLFAFWPDLPEGGRKTEKETTERVEELQNASLMSIYSTLGIAGVQRLIAGAKDAARAGYLCGKYLSDKKDVRELILGNLASSEYSHRVFALEFARAVFDLNKWDSLQPLLDEAKKANVSDQAVAELFLGASIGKITWDKLATEPPDVERHYWSTLNIHVLHSVDTEEYEYAVTKLLDLDRAPDVLDEMAYGREDVPSSLMVRALEIAPRNLNEAARANLPVRVSSHDIARVFEKLEKAADVDEEKIAQLELPFVTILRLDRPRLVIHREVAQSPIVFADLISWVYKRSDGLVDDDGILQEEREARAKTAWSILHGVSVVPGQKPDGSINQDEQLEWAQEALRLCKERGREVVGRQTIGQVLGCCPSGSDGIWPHESVRKTLDTLSDKEIGLGLQIRKQNMRGVVSRGLYDGGTQERGLAQQYRDAAARLRPEYPFTASVLKNLADSYEGQAVAEDNDAAWMDR